MRCEFLGSKPGVLRLVSLLTTGLFESQRVFNLQLTPEEEAEKLQRTVFVGNVPVSKKTKTKLTEIFIR